MIYNRLTTRLKSCFNTCSNIKLLKLWTSNCSFLKYMDYNRATKKTKSSNPKLENLKV